jgi:hypothetical protein
MKYLTKFTKRLARDWHEFLHDATIHFTDHKQEKPETRKINNVLLIVSYLVVGWMIFSK